MVQGSVSETERKIIAILKVLNESSEPLGSLQLRGNWNAMEFF